MTATVHVRPRRSLLRTAFLSIVLVTAIIFGVLYWFSIEHGTWRIVLVLNIVVVVASFSVLFRQLSVFTEVTSTELVGRGIFSPIERVPLSEIATVTLVPTYIGQAPEPVVQLLVRNAEGKRLFRMRGNFWHPGDLAAVAAAVNVPVTTVSEAISLRDFFRLYPGSAYWFENRPIVRVVVIVALVIVALVIAVVLMLVFGMKVGIFGG
jgi:hypothetical protein